MTQLKAVLIDDEKKLLEVLKIKINQICPELDIVGTANNAQSGFKIIKRLSPDIVFLDIGMPGESGFDMLKRFDQIDFEIIFVTGYNDYALKAIKFCAIGYVLKPVISEELVAAVKNAKVRIESKIAKEQYKYFFEQLTNPEKKNKRIGIPTENGIEFVHINEIIRCEFTKRHTHVSLTDGSSIISMYSLGRFFKLLAEYRFFLSHKSHLVNLSNVLKYDKEGILIMTDGSMVPLSRRKRYDFMELIDRID